VAVADGVADGEALAEGVRDGVGVGEAVALREALAGRVASALLPVPEPVDVLTGWARPVQDGMAPVE
jgi:hypothetical protein